MRFFQKKHTGKNIKKFIDDNLAELDLNLENTPCTTDKGSNIICTTKSKTHVDCSCHRLNTAIDTARKQDMAQDDNIQQLNTFSHKLVKYVNQASGIQSNVSVSLKHKGEAHPWRSLSDMFSSISRSHEALIPQVRERKTI